MKKLFGIFLLTVAVFALSACKNDKKADIVTTGFVQYDIARQIVGDKLSVSLLTPIGAELHGYEATSRDLVAIREAKLFIFTSFEIDQWITDPNTLAGSDTVVLNLSNLYEHDDDDHDHEHEHTNSRSTISKLSDDHDHDHDDDLHFWVDPLIVLQLIHEIAEAIEEIDPDNADFYHENAHAYSHEIEEAHHAFDDYLHDHDLEDSTIYFAGHNAMGLFGERYHLDIHALYENFTPDAELVGQQLIDFVNAVKQANTRYLFVESIVVPRAAQTVKNELAKEGYSLTILELHNYENVSLNDWEARVSYLDLLNRNIANLKTALSNQ